MYFMSSPAREIIRVLQNNVRWLKSPLILWIELVDNNSQFFFIILLSTQVREESPKEEPTWILPLRLTILS
jgi:hypothetical protein